MKAYLKSSILQLSIKEGNELALHIRQRESPMTYEHLELKAVRYFCIISVYSPYREDNQIRL